MRSSSLHTIEIRNSGRVVADPDMTPIFGSAGGCAMTIQSASRKHSQWSPPRSSSRYRYSSIDIRVIEYKSSVDPESFLSFGSMKSSKPLICFRFT